MSKSQRWVPSFPGDTPVWELAVMAAAVGALVFLLVTDQARGVLLYVPLIAVAALGVWTAWRDVRRFGWYWSSARTNAVAILACFALWALLRMLTQFSDGGSGWGVLAACVMVAAGLSANALIQASMRRDYQRRPAVPSPKPSPEAAQL